MRIFIDNPIILYATLGGSIISVIGLTVVLIRRSIKNQLRELLEYRLEYSKYSPAAVCKLPPSVLLPELPPTPTAGKKLWITEFLSERIGSRLNQKTVIMGLIGYLVFLLASFFAAYFFLGVYVGLTLGLATSAICVGALWILKFKRDRYLMKCEAQLPEVIDLIVRALRAGHVFTTAVSIAGEELPAPLGPEFNRIFKEQELGIPLTSALINLTKKIPLTDLKYLVTAYLINRELGGNLAEVLEKISVVIRERFKLKRHVQGITAEARYSAYIIGGLPFITTVAIYLVRPGYFDILVKEPFGQKLILLAIIMWFLGVMTIKKLIKIDY